jgi:subtilisin family serine protease
MGTMVGSDGSGNQIGVAPEAQWIACRNMRKGVGSVASYLECFEFLLAPYPLGGDPKKDGRPEMAPHIVNNSWGCPDTEGCKGGELLNAVRAMRAAGIFVVASAGNDGGDCMSVFKAPAQYSGDLLSVGAYNRFDHGATWFSSRGPSAWNGGLAPTIVAPGDGIRSAVNSGAGDYGDKEGTSMASPQVAGAIALIWSASPKLIGKIDQTIELLERTAQPLKATQSCGDFPGDKVPNAVFGYGLLDAYAAVKAAREL